MKKISSIIYAFLIIISSPFPAYANYSNGVIAMMFGQSDYAVSEFKKAAAEGHIEATYSLGYMYENEVGIAKDYNLAMMWYKKAAALGDVKSQYIIGNMYNRGRGVTINYVEAVKWYSIAAKNDYAWAQYFYGQKLELGQGITKNEIEAAIWYERAAEQEHATAQYNLAKIYYEGRGKPKNYLLSYKWALLAEAYANNDAKELISELIQKISPNDAKIVRENVKVWIKTHR